MLRKVRVPKAQTLRLLSTKPPTISTQTFFTYRGNEFIKRTNFLRQQTHEEFKEFKTDIRHNAFQYPSDPGPKNNIEELEEDDDDEDAEKQ